jgi:hypothetical protein
MSQERGGDPRRTLCGVQDGPPLENDDLIEQIPQRIRADMGILLKDSKIMPGSLTFAIPITNSAKISGLLTGSGC